jgi:hypothetical protein
MTNIMGAVNQGASISPVLEKKNGNNPARGGLHLTIMLATLAGFMVSCNF